MPMVESWLAIFLVKGYTAHSVVVGGGRQYTKTRWNSPRIVENALW